jgi:hypothetical protein
MRNLCFTERSLQFSKFAHKSVGNPFSPSSLFFLSLALIFSSTGSASSWGFFPCFLPWRGSKRWWRQRLDGALLPRGQRRRAAAARVLGGAARLAARVLGGAALGGRRRARPLRGRAAAAQAGQFGTGLVQEREPARVRAPGAARVNGAGARAEVSDWQRRRRGRAQAMGTATAQHWRRWN